jgi:methyl-accepting chemotaxis protein
LQRGNLSLLILERSLEFPDLPEWLKIIFGMCGGVFAWMLVIWLSKEWVSSNIIEPIQEQKENLKEMRRIFDEFHDKVTGFMFQVVTTSRELTEHNTKEIDKMSKLFTEATQHTARTSMFAAEALEKVNVLEKITEKSSETVIKLIQISNAVNEKNKELHTEVKKISDDLIMIKNKIGSGK